MFLVAVIGLQAVFSCKHTVQMLDYLTEGKKSKGILLSPWQLIGKNEKKIKLQDLLFLKDLDAGRCLTQNWALRGWCQIQPVRQLVKLRCVQPGSVVQNSPCITAPATTKQLKISEHKKTKCSAPCGGPVPHGWLCRKLVLAEHDGKAGVALLHALKQKKRTDYWTHCSI